MGQVTFSISLSGGNDGFLGVSFDTTSNGLNLNFRFTRETITLPKGDNVCTFSGMAPMDPGAIELTISGDVDEETRKVFMTGPIEPTSLTINVTV